MNSTYFTPFTPRKALTDIPQLNISTQEISDLLEKFIIDFHAFDEKKFVFLIMAYKAENNNDSTITSDDINHVINALSQNKNAKPQLISALVEYQQNNPVSFLKTGVELYNKDTQKNINMLLQTSPEMLASNVDAASRGHTFPNPEQHFELQKIEGALTTDRNRQERETVKKEINAKLAATPFLSPEAKKILQIYLMELIAERKLTPSQVIMLTSDQIINISLFKEIIGSSPFSLEKILSLTKEQINVRISRKTCPLYTQYMREGMLSPGQVLSLDQVQANELVDYIDSLAAGILLTRAQKSHPDRMKWTKKEQIQQAFIQLLEINGINNPITLQKIKEGVTTIDGARQALLTVQKEIEARLANSPSLSPEAIKILQRCQRNLLQYFGDGMLTIDMAARLTDKQVDFLKMRQIQELIAEGKLTVMEAIRLTPDQVKNIDVFKRCFMDTGYLSLEKTLSLTQEQFSVRISRQTNPLYTQYMGEGMLAPGQILSLNQVQANELADRITRGKLTTEQQIQQAFMDITNPRN